MLIGCLSRHVLTGSYHNYFRIFDVHTLQDIVLQADKSAFKAKKVGGPLPGKPPMKNGPRVGLGQVQVDALDFNKKILHASWHPREYTIAVCRSFTSTVVANLDHSHIDCCHKQLVLIQCGINVIDVTATSCGHCLFDFPLLSCPLI
jgi:hypothetical protein